MRVLAFLLSSKKFFTGLLLLLCISNSTPLLAQHWQQINGPTSPDGIQVATGDGADRILAATVSGINLSSDTGNTWHRDSASIWCRAIIRTSDGRLIVGGEDAICWSSDFGQTWTRLPWPWGSLSFIHRLSLDSNGTIYGVGGPYWPYGMTDIIYRSTDTAKTWVPLYSLRGIYDVQCSKTGMLIAKDTAGVFRSSDRGESWQVSDIRPDISDYASQPIAVGANGIVFYVSNTSGAKAPICRSSDNGLNWVACDTGLPVYATSYGVEKGYIFSVFVTPKGSLLVGEGDGSIWRSSDNGATWSFATLGSQSFPIQRFSANGNVIYAAQWFGVFVSSDDGKSWARASLALPDKSVTDITVDSAKLFAATEGAGIARTLKRTNNWKPCNVGIRHYDFVSLQSALGNLYATTDSGHIYRSTNGGAQWFGQRVSQFKISTIIASANGHLFAGADSGIYRSTDSGGTWSAFGFGLPWSHVLGIVAHQSHKLLAALDGLGVYLSSDEGATWVSKSPKTQVAPPIALCVDSSGNILASMRDTIFRSTDAGNTWTGTKWRGADVTGFLSTATSIFAATTYGVFQSMDAGLSWNQIDSGKTVVGLTKLAIGSDGTLFAATQDSGVYEWVSSSSVSEQRPNDWSFECQPNPANGNVSIRFVLPEEQSLKATLYDLLGCEARALPQRVYPVGQNMLEFDTQDLPVGVYYVRLTSAALSATRSVIVSH